MSDLVKQRSVDIWTPYTCGMIPYDRIHVKLSISHIDHVPSQTMPGLDNIRGSKVPRSDVGVMYEIARGDQ